MKKSYATSLNWWCPYSIETSSQLFAVSLNNWTLQTQGWAGDSSHLGWSWKTRHSSGNSPLPHLFPISDECSSWVLRGFKNESFHFLQNSSRDFIFHMYSLNSFDYLIPRYCQLRNEEPIVILTDLETWYIPKSSWVFCYCCCLALMGISISTPECFSLNRLSQESAKASGA